MKARAPARVASVLLLWGCAIAAQAAVYELVPADSRLLVLVYRAGALSGLGHNHVVAATHMEGEVDFQPQALQRSSVALRLPVREFEVDDPQLRAAAGEGFAGDLDPEDVRGTRRNMLGPEVLDAERYPVIEVSGRPVEGELPQLRMQLEIEMHGVRRQMQVPMQVRREGDRLRAQGSVRIAQSAFGIDPLTIMFGAVAVRDEVEVRFDLVAERRESQ